MASGTASAAFRSLARSRHSCRRFAPDRPVPSEALKDALLTTRASPSGFNLQPTHMLLVRDPTVKRRLADEAMLGMGNVYRTRDCSAVAVFLSDLQVTRRIARITELERESGARDPPRANRTRSGKGFTVWRAHGFENNGWHRGNPPIDKEFDTSYATVAEANARARFVFYCDNPWGLGASPFSSHRSLDASPFGANRSLP